MLLIACSLLVGATGCKDRQGSSDETDAINIPPIGADPNRDRPRTFFPAELQQADTSFNKFVDDVLQICQTGDYDRFCGLFAAADAPPARDDFARIWRGVSEIKLVSIYPARPNEYFVHAIARLRQADSRRRLQRDVVVHAFKELDEWRISGAPQEIARKVLHADSRPAGGGSAGSQPASAAAP